MFSWICLTARADVVQRLLFRSLFSWICLTARLPQRARPERGFDPCSPGLCLNGEARRGARGFRSLFSWICLCRLRPVAPYSAWVSILVLLDLPQRRAHTRRRMGPVSILVLLDLSPARNASSGRRQPGRFRSLFSWICLNGGAGDEGTRRARGFRSLFSWICLYRPVPWSHASRSHEVSILVLLDLVCRALIRVCRYISGVSILVLLDLPHGRRRECPNAGGGFDPCSPGSASTAGDHPNAYALSMFRSLFSWICSAGRAASRCSLAAVSILVLLDLPQRRRDPGNRA